MSLNALELAQLIRDDMRSGRDEVKSVTHQRAMGFIPRL